MTEAEQFAACDACEGNTMLVFSDAEIAHRYVEHRARLGDSGVICMVEDKFGSSGSGICVLWRDPIDERQLDERLANCRWLLEEVLAGRQPRPVAGQVNTLWSGGFPAHLAGGHA
mgnify:CR=1 FL=1